MGLFFAFGISFDDGPDYSEPELELAPLLSLDVEFYPTSKDNVKPFQYVEETLYGNAD